MRKFDTGQHGRITQAAALNSTAVDTGAPHGSGLNGATNEATTHDTNAVEHAPAKGH